MSSAMSAAPNVERAPTEWASPKMRARTARRYRSEAYFRNLGLFALVLAASFLAFLLVTVVRDGWQGFLATEVKISVTYDAATLGIDPAAINGADAKNALQGGDFQAIMATSVTKLGEDADTVSEGAWLVLRRQLMADPSLLGQTVTVWVPAKSSIDLLAKGKFDLSKPALERGVSDIEVAHFNALKRAGLVRTGFNRTFLTSADSTSPELAGVWGATVGSLLTLAVTLGLAFPIGVLSAIYLEEFAKRNRWTDFIEVSINNLAAVPSIIYGLLGLAVFLNFFNMPRSAPIVGGLTLALMTFPVIVISGRVAIKSVPPSIRDAALGIGASKIQVVFQHVLPLALPGILTGTIIGMARALGETAPLLMIGMRAFVSDTPTGLLAPATALPVQVFLWSDDVARGFVEKTSAAIMVLLVFLLMMNSLAIYLRNKYERRW